MRSNARHRTRRWGVYVFRNLRGAPMVSLGVHLDLHTPVVDIHLPVFTVKVGRMYLASDPGWFRYIGGPERWSGHMGDCGCNDNADANLWPTGL
jgi:hypothetical protein